MSVYLDACFFPNLNKMDFLQEGWRLEHEDPLSTDTPIMYKGVVYNEMKGAFSSIDYLYAVRAQNELFPGSTYGNVSGGDPPAILDLSWEELKQFHADHYHPTNAVFYSYGDLPLEATLYGARFSAEAYTRGYHWITSIWLGRIKKSNHRCFHGAKLATSKVGERSCRRVTNGIPLGCPLLLPVGTVNSVATLKGCSGSAGVNTVHQVREVGGVAGATTVDSTTSSAWDMSARCDGRGPFQADTLFGGIPPAI
jgi:hypothetical protein